MQDVHTWTLTPIRGVGAIDLVLIYRPASAEGNARPRTAEGPDVRVYGAPGLDDFQLEEVTDRGVVSTLDARNHSPFGVLLLAGQLVKGGKQNRGVNADLLVMPGREAKVPVTCVEVGRWDRAGDGKFRHGGVEPVDLRQGKFTRTSVARRAARENAHWSDDAGQRDVWNHIDRIYARASVKKGSADLLNILEQDPQHSASSSAARLAAADAVAAGAVGLMVLRRGALLALDVFGRPEWFQTMQHDLCRSALFEASFADRWASRADWGPSPEELAACAGVVRDSLGEMLKGEWVDGTSLADGQTRLLHQPGVSGVALSDGTGQLLHLLVMAEQPQRAAVHPYFP